MLFPMAFMVQTNVTSCPRSADTTDPSCFLPFSAIMLFGVCTVVAPVSSTLNIDSGENFCLKKIKLNVDA